MQDTIRDLRKNKVQLSDYAYEADIQNRILLSKLSFDAITVLEEILCNSLSFSIKSLSENLDLDRTELNLALDELHPTRLFVIDGSMINVDKEKRKYFETHIEKFNEDFRPDLDYLQSLLKHIPIQHLPLWYQIPRSSNNIFASLIEKCFITPSVFQRYYNDFISGEDLYSQIVKDVYESDELFLTKTYLKEKYHLTEEKYQETVLYLELNLLLASSYKKEDHTFTEILSPFQEWRDYVFALRSNRPTPLTNNIEIYREHEFAFIEDMTTILLLSKQTSLEVTFIPSADKWIFAKPSQVNAIDAPDEQYLVKLLNKLLILGLALVELPLESNLGSLEPSEPSYLLNSGKALAALDSQENPSPFQERVLQADHLRLTEIAHDWIKTPIEKRAHITFKHPHHFLSLEKQSRLSSQRSVLEIEKSIALVKALNWISFDDFLSKAIIPLGEDDRVSLKRIAGTWVYKFPEYDLEAKNFIKYVIMDWLFECGMVQIGSHKGAPCFRVTTLGQTIFL